MSSERLAVPVEKRELNEKERLKLFEDYILAIHQGKGFPYPIPQSELQKILEKGNGAPGEYSYMKTRALYMGVSREERDLVLQAIANLIEDEDVPHYTKAALLSHSLPGFSRVVVPSILKLFESNSSVSPVLQEQYDLHKVFWRRDIEDFFAEDKFVTSQRFSSITHHVSNTNDYVIKIPKERHDRRKWNVSFKKDFEDNYDFYPIGFGDSFFDGNKRLLSIDIYSSKGGGERQVTIMRYERHTLEEFLPIASFFIDTILKEEDKVLTTKVDEYPDTPSGIHIYPDDDSKMIGTEEVYLQFPSEGNQLTRQMLEEALRQNSYYNNYSLDECSITILTPKGNQISFNPFISNDLARHLVENSQPYMANYFIRLQGIIDLDLVYKLIMENSSQGFPSRKIKSILNRYQV